MFLLGSFLKTKHGFSCINWCHAGNTASCVRRQVDDFATESQGPKTEDRSLKNDENKKKQKSNFTLHLTSFDFLEYNKIEIFNL